MDFKYKEIDDKEGKGENIFHTPNFAINPKKDTYETFIANGYSVSSYNGAEDTYRFKSQFNYYDLQEATRKHIRLATVKPTAEELKAIKIIIDLAKAKDTEAIYVGQLIFDGFGDKKGLSIFCNYGRIGVLYDSKYIGCMVGDNYKKVFKMLEYRNGMPVKKANFPEIVKMVSKLPKEQETKRIKREQDAQKKNIQSQTAAIKADKDRYKASIIALEKVKEAKKIIPKDVQILLERGEMDAKMLINSVKDRGRQCLVYSKKVKELDEEKEFVTSKATTDFKAIDKLIKKGVIESIVYEGSKGLSWVYPPMTYQPRHPDMPKEVFLGRVKVTVLEKPDNSTLKYIKFAPISYAETTAAGSWHFGHRHLCLGSYEPTINRLLACGSIGGLIVVARDYIQSANTLSPVHTPDWKLMNIEKPGVTDDSFTKWKELGSPRLTTQDTSAAHGRSEVPF